VIGVPRLEVFGHSGPKTIVLILSAI